MKTIAFAILQVSGGKISLETLNEPKWPKVYLGYKKGYYIDSLGKKQGIEFPDQGSLYHGVKLFLYNSERCSTFSFPVLIKGKDTILSASDGGFFSGLCNYQWVGDSIFITGKYSKISYARMADSNYRYMLRSGKSGLFDKAMGVNFKRFEDRDVRKN